MIGLVPAIAPGGHLLPLRLPLLRRRLVHLCRHLLRRGLHLLRRAGARPPPSRRPVCLRSPRTEWLSQRPRPRSATSSVCVDGGSGWGHGAFSGGRAQLRALSFAGISWRGRASGLQPALSRSICWRSARGKRGFSDITRAQVRRSSSSPTRSAWRSSWKPSARGGRRSDRPGWLLFVGFV